MNDIDPKPDDTTEAALEQPILIDLGPDEDNSNSFLKKPKVSPKLSEISEHQEE